MHSPHSLTILKINPIKEGFGVSFLSVFVRKRDRLVHSWTTKELIQMTAWYKERSISLSPQVPWAMNFIALEEYNLYLQKKKENKPTKITFAQCSFILNLKPTFCANLHNMVVHERDSRMISYCFLHDFEFCVVLHLYWLPTEARYRLRPSI